MVKNNGDFHFFSPLSHHLLFFHSCRKATCWLLYVFLFVLLNFIPSTWNLEDAGWMMTMMVISFCHFVTGFSVSVAEHGIKCCQRGWDRIERKKIISMGYAHCGVLCWIFAHLVSMTTIQDNYHEGLSKLENIRPARWVWEGKVKERKGEEE